MGTKLQETLQNLEIRPWDHVIQHGCELIVQRYSPTLLHYIEEKKKTKQA